MMTKKVSNKFTKEKPCPLIKFIMNLYIMNAANKLGNTNKMNADFFCAGLFTVIVWLSIEQSVIVFIFYLQFSIMIILLDEVM